MRYLTFKLSSRDLVQMMAERGIALAHTTILRWIQRYVPEFEKRWQAYARPVGGSWRVDETYIKIKGHWAYLYRAVDRAGHTVDFLLSRRRDMAAAQRFFSRTIRQHGAPRVITLDGYAASHRAVAKLKAAGTLPGWVQVRSSKYLNNLIEQDHRRIKQRLRPMLGFKRFEPAAVTIRGIELAAKIKKQQFDLKPLTGKATTAPEIWAAVLAALLVGGASFPLVQIVRYEPQQFRYGPYRSLAPPSARGDPGARYARPSALIQA